MPFDRGRYPENWEEIARGAKERAGWRCEGCGRPCRKPGQSWPEFVGTLSPDLDWRWYRETYDEVGGETVEKPGRFVLTTAHIDPDPMNCAPANLKALCPKCHNALDAPMRSRNRRRNAMRRREESGQLNLFRGDET